MKYAIVFYAIGIITALCGATTLPAKPGYQYNSGNTESQNAAIQQKIDDDYKATVLASLQFKIIIAGIVIILITILCHIYFGSRRVAVLPLHAPLKSAIRKVAVLPPLEALPQASPSPQLISSQPPPQLYIGPVITYVPR